jgi:hypothetical protein
MCRPRAPTTVEELAGVPERTPRTEEEPPCPEHSNDWAGFAARRPWVVIATWAAVCVVVVTSAAAFGRELDDPFEAPGLDSHRATELLTQAGSADMGLGRRRRPHAA